MLPKIVGLGILTVKQAFGKKRIAFKYLHSLMENFLHLESFRRNSGQARRAVAGLRGQNVGRAAFAAAGVCIPLL